MEESDNASSIFALKGFLVAINKINLYEKEIIYDRDTGFNLNILQGKHNI
jgi:hypothetical protein